MAPEPVVIELKDERQTNIEVRHAGHKCELTFGVGLHGSEVDGLFVRISDRWTHTDFSMRPDPATAVLKERERFDAAASAVLTSDQYSALNDAIDAPPDEPSEYRQGAEDIERQVFELLDLRIQKRYRADSYAAERQALQGFAKFLRREWCMEPPPATEPSP